MQINIYYYYHYHYLFYREFIFIILNERKNTNYVLVMHWRCKWAIINFFVVFTNVWTFAWHVLFSFHSLIIIIIINNIAFHIVRFVR